MKHTTRHIRMPGLVLGAALLLPGCGWLMGDDGYFRDREGDYRDERPRPPPVVPMDLRADTIGDAMFIPEVPGMDGYLAQADFELPRPASLFAREEDRGVRIQRFGGESWVVAPDPPSLVWPRLLQFLADNGVSVEREVPRDGLLETQWVEISGERYRDVVRTILVEEGADLPLHRFKVEVGQAVRRGATEISLVHLGATEAEHAREWPERSTNPRVAETLLNELAGYLAAEVGQGGISLRAQSIATQPKAEVVAPRDEPPALRLRLDYDRAWATIGTALNNAEIQVLESDSATGNYQVRFDESALRGEEPGWFRRTFSFGDPARRGDLLTLRLQPASEGFALEVFDRDGNARVDRDTAEQVLLVVREFAS